MHLFDCCLNRSVPDLRPIWGAILGLAIAAVAPSASGAESELISLDEALALALKANPKVDNAALGVEKSNYALVAARTHYLPTLGLGVHSSHNMTEQQYTYERGAFGTYPFIGPIPANTTRLGSESGTSTVVTATLSQPLIQLYRTGLEVDQHQLMLSMSEQLLRAERQGVVKQVKQQYYEILKTQSSLAATQEEIAFLRELFGLVHRYVEEKTALLYQELEVRSRLARTEHKARSERNLLLTQMQRLNGLMGRDVRTPFRVANADAVDTKAMDRADAEAQALARRPEIEQARLKLEHAQYGYRIKKAEYLPDLNFVMNYSRLENVDLIPNQVWTVGLQMRWDIYDWGRKSSQLGEKTAGIMEARNDIRSAEAQILTEVDSDLRQLTEAKEYVTVTEFAQTAAREKLRVLMNQYREKTALLSDVLQAESQLADANSEYQKALLSLFDAKAQLDKALGEE
jgi:outer membrane protein